MLNALGLGYSETKIKPYLKMGVQRIQIANNKKVTSVKHQKKELAALLADKKDEKARIKVEHIIRDDFLIEAYELIELLCELLHERIRQVTTSKDAPPEDLKETIYSLVWAAVNCDITELQEVRKHLIRKYGSEYFKVIDENPGSVVNARLFNKLSYRPPGRVLVNRYLVEIADVYKIDWEPPIECEAVDDESPFSTPSGFSIAMAPGSGLASAYSTAPAPTATAVSGKASSAPPAVAAAVPPAAATRKLSPAEQEEYDLFHKHQTSPVHLAPAFEPVYAAVPGPPPHLKGAAGVGSATSVPPAAARFPAGQQEQDGDDDDEGEGGGKDGGNFVVPPPAPLQPPPPAPAAPTPAPQAPVDPMADMLARLAALQSQI